MSSVPAVPVIDLSLPDNQVARRIHDACLTNGFFYVKNHGIGEELVEKVLTEVKNFFALPMDEKMRILQNKHDRGFVPPFAERLDVKTSKEGDSKESIYFGLEDLEDELPLRGPNLWPDETVLPDFRHTIQKYFDQIYELAQKRLTRLMALSLGLEATAFDVYVKDPTVMLHPLHYLPILSAPEKGAFACGAHSDYGIVTVLATDDVGGLQIKLGEDEWLDVPYKKDMFIINIGDMTERLTNGLYKSTVHRVVNTHGKERYSIPLFFDPNVNVEIEPLPQFCEDGVQKYETCRYGDYLLNKYTTTNDGYVGPARMEEEA